MPLGKLGSLDARDGRGHLREALTSLFGLFDVTRRILRDAGPAVARMEPGATVSFGHLAIAILNHSIRPFLATWRPRLKDHEISSPSAMSTTEWEREWDE